MLKTQLMGIDFMKTIATIFLLLIFNYSVASNDIEKTHYNIYFADDIQSPISIGQIPVTVADKYNLKEHQTVYGKDDAQKILLESVGYDIGRMIKNMD